MHKRAQVLITWVNFVTIDEKEHQRFLLVIANRPRNIENRIVQVKLANKASKERVEPRRQRVGRFIGLKGGAGLP